MRIPTYTVNCCQCGSARHAHVTYTRDYNYKTCDNEFEFVRCADCRQVYLHNRPDLSALSVIYPENYEAYATQTEVRPGLLARIKRYFIGRKLKPLRKLCPANSALMEVGCGTGDLLRLIKRFGDSSWKLYGVDITDTHFASLQAAGITTIRARFEELEGFDARFDAIVMNQVIEHLADPIAITTKANFMLKPGGVLILETPSLEGWDARLFAKHGLWEGWHAPRHWQVFDEETLAAVAKKSGLKHLATEYILSPYLWIYSIRNFLEFHKQLPWLQKHLNLQNFLALTFVSSIDMLQLLMRGKTSNMRMVLQKL